MELPATWEIGLWCEQDGSLRGSALTPTKMSIQFEGVGDVTESISPSAPLVGAEIWSEPTPGNTLKDSCQRRWLGGYCWVATRSVLIALVIVRFAAGCWWAMST